MFDRLQFHGLSLVSTPHSFLGAAEVAAWGVLGVIWESLEEIVNAISEGCEVRVANTLGKGDAKTAKLITYKAIWISLIWGVLVSIVFLLFEDEIPRLITTDPVLREMVSFNLPMISLANIVSGIAIMAEHVLWCQNRAKLATIIASATSLLVTLPLAGLSSFVFDFNLIGQTAGVAIGAAAFAASSMHAVISSDWKQISEDVMAIHADEDESDEESSDDEDEELSSASEEEGEEEE
jgi:Na+-driven multidrug efflux pump